MSYKFSQPLDVAAASIIALPKGLYWNMNSNQDIIGLFQNREECNYDSNFLASLLKDIERQALTLGRTVKTPIYMRRAKKAYYERQKLNNPSFLSDLNEKNKARQRMQREVKALMCINV